MKTIRTAVTVPLGLLHAIEGRGGARRGLVAQTFALARWQLQWISRRLRMAATRDALDSLDDRMLKDIGLRRMDLPSVVSNLYDSRSLDLPRMLVRDRS